MAKCELSIELDEPNRVYHEGEKVQGVAYVKVDSTVKCTGLVLSTGWKTHGRGNVTSGPAEETTVFSGQWTQGNKYEYRFSLSAGDWPLFAFVRLGSGVFVVLRRRVGSASLFLGSARLRCFWFGSGHYPG